ncbi:MAG: hypothetical protein PVI59_01430 [Anaerolineae bacterium]|jgi:hypothetical protein
MRKRFTLALVLALFVLLVTGEGPLPGALETGVNGVVDGLRFDFVSWEGEALWTKFVHWLIQPQRYMTEPDRSDFVRDYETLLTDIHRLEGEIEAVYADPEVADADAVTAELRADWSRLRAEAAARQPATEAIIEEQVATILSQEGLGFLGQPFPPVGLRFTPLPNVLVISRRDRIETIHQVELEPGLGVARQVAVEESVDEAFDVSSLVVGIGGLSAWPAMVLDWPALDWITEVTSHEWTHHYLDLRPLGWEYSESQAARTINETTASIVGEEVGRRVLARYYPDLLPEPPPEEEGNPETLPVDPPVFDFRLEMHRTRVEVDRLLADGEIEAAEAYMEERRVFFWEHGYRGIRKLNQAYFAFHGSYADMPGAAGEDPIGPAVRELRQQSSSLRSFLSQIAFITNLDELQVAVHSATLRTQ